MKVNSVIVRRGMMKLALLVLVATGFLFQESARANGFYQTFKATVTIQESPPSISFAWTFQPYMEGTLKRRALPSVDTSVTETWQKVKTIPMGSTTVTDTTAVVGMAYEYAIEFSGYRYAYVAAGIRLPLEESRGKILLMVDQTMATPCAAELARLQQDLVGDGWQVIRHNVPRDDGNYSTRHQAKSVKATILADYQSDPANVKAVLLFGHVPVPYSGWDIPDGHEFRTLNADAYYGDMTGVWTDNTVSNISIPTGIRGSNIPGDGKFDQNVIPANVELMAPGRSVHPQPPGAPKVKGCSTVCCCASSHARMADCWLEVSPGRPGSYERAMTDWTVTQVARSESIGHPPSGRWAASMKATPRRIIS